MLTQQHNQAAAAGGETVQRFMLTAIIIAGIVATITAIPQFVFIATGKDFTTPARYWDHAIKTGCTVAYTNQTSSGPFTYDPANDKQHDQCDQMSQAGFNLTKLIQTGYNNLLFVVSIASGLFVAGGMVYRLQGQEEEEEEEQGTRNI